MADVGTGVEAVGSALAPVLGDEPHRSLLIRQLKSDEVKDAAADGVPYSPGSAARTHGLVATQAVRRLSRGLRRDAQPDAAEELTTQSNGVHNAVVHTCWEAQQLGPPTVNPPAGHRRS